MVELVDTCDSNSHAERRNGSSPFIPTKLKKEQKNILIGYNFKNMNNFLLFLFIYISIPMVISTDVVRGNAAYSDKVNIERSA